MGPTLDELADDLAAGRTSSRALVEQCLARIDASGGQGGTVFTLVDRAGALAAADEIDALRRAGRAPSRYAGIPVSIKDLFDVAGQVTRAASVALDGPPAAADAPAVARLRAAGFVPIGRANMTEFAFSGLGLNPHYGTPLSPWRRDERHIAGGSTSGGAASVADGMAHAALGTDTGGSLRIPAAFCGLVGYKPTADRVPRDGAVPLSTSLDSVGPIARSVACCAALDAILAGTNAPELDLANVAGLRFLAPINYGLDGMDDEVAAAFEAALVRLEQAGAGIDRAPVDEFDRIAEITAKGGLAAAESWAWHKDLIARAGDRYDPRVLVRIRRGAGLTPEDVAAVHDQRRQLIDAMAARLAGYDAMVMPTAPVVPPRLADLADDEDEYTRVNMLVLRNPTAINMIDGCAVSLPLTPPAGAPAGLMLARGPHQDAALLRVAAAVEGVLNAAG